jgi:uncharacterized membrane protein YeaQ/YmgE (transglycosylase-associated protein family)
MTRVGAPTLGADHSALHIAPMPPRTRKSPKPDRVVRDEEVEVLPPRRSLPLDWGVVVATVAFGTVTGFVASLIVGGGGVIRHAVVGVLGMLVGQGIVRLTGWRLNTGYGFLDDAGMAVLGAILVILLARFIA